MNSSAPLDFATLAYESLDILKLGKQLLSSENIQRDGRAAQTLAKSKGLTVVLTAVRAGGKIDEHSAQGPVTIVPVIGSVSISKANDAPAAAPIASGQVLFMGAGQKHRVDAREDSAFLLIIGSQA